MLAAIELLEQRVELRVAGVDVIGIGEQADTVQVEGIQGVGHLGERAIHVW